jgi:hypothetical protein
MRIDEISTNNVYDLELSHQDYRKILKAMKAKNLVSRDVLGAKSKIMKMWKMGDRDLVKYSSILKNFNLDLDDLARKGITDL